MNNFPSWNITDPRVIERNEEEKAIAEITQKLEYLPLAIDHAGSYILKEQCTFESYLEQLEENISFYLSKGWKEGGDKDSVFASWEMSLEVLRQRVPKATDLLSICGFLDNNDISDEFLQRGMNLKKNSKYRFFLVYLTQPPSPVYSPDPVPVFTYTPPGIFPALRLL